MVYFCAMKVHAYKMLPGMFGLVSYFPETVVRIATFRDEPSMTEALARMNAQGNGNEYVAADSQTEKWGKVCFRAQGSAEMVAFPE